ncbi:hypothetical protein E5358_09540 [Palleniella muris]|uniref:Uncharacterized protein n=1 Tax=Palleniella muris TaxID=3038145 RepID=A0AC61QPB6_9BACT|nr:hypothetical protein E5358_09540 [Palleniella muris]
MDTIIHYIVQMMEEAQLYYIESIKEGSKLKYEGMTENEALGSVLSHEAVHCTDINEIDADLKYESKHGRHPRPNREDKTKEIEDKIKEELKRLCGM